MAILLQNTASRFLGISWVMMDLVAFKLWVWNVFLLMKGGRGLHLSFLLTIFWVFEDFYRNMECWFQNLCSSWMNHPFYSGILDIFTSLLVNSTLKGDDARSTPHKCINFYFSLKNYCLNWIFFLQNSITERPHTPTIQDLCLTLQKHCNLN